MVVEFTTQATLALKGRMAVSGNHVGKPAVDDSPVRVCRDGILGIQ
jgi:hypothetical protein